MRDKWFSYDPDDGFEIHATEAKARARAEHSLSRYRDDAGDGWPEELDSICYGRVGGRVVETERRPATEDDGIPGCDEYVDYALEETPDDRLEAALAGESAALERVAELEARTARVLVAVQLGFVTAALRWSEWGTRAEAACEAFEKALELLEGGE